MPFPMRRVLTTWGVWWLQLIRRVRNVDSRHTLTPPKDMFELSFWGVPSVNIQDYRLVIDGHVQNAMSISMNELLGFGSVERQVTMDCVGGSRNNSLMRGLDISDLFDMAKPDENATTAIFYCADGYMTTHPIHDLVETNAFLAYGIYGAEYPKFGFPLRLVAPGKYGYKWAKWVTRIELVMDSPKGYWEQRGLPDRAWVGDIR